MPELIYFVSGPPAAGKSTLAEHLVARTPKGVVIPVDDLRLWVRSGLSESVPWTDETERQFQIAEEAACHVARTYAMRGFVVVVDHCRNPARLDAVVSAQLSDMDVRKVLLLPDLETNLSRNYRRTNKDFEPSILDDTIRFTNEHYGAGISADWLVIDNGKLTPLETAEMILADAIERQSR